MSGKRKEIVRNLSHARAYLDYAKCGIPDDANEKPLPMKLFGELENGIKATLQAYKLMLEFNPMPDEEKAGLVEWLESVERATERENEEEEYPENEVADPPLEESIAAAQEKIAAGSLATSPKKKK